MSEKSWDIISMRSDLFETSQNFVLIMKNPESSLVNFQFSVWTTYKRKVL